MMSYENLAFLKTTKMQILKLYWGFLSVAVNIHCHARYLTIHNMKIIRYFLSQVT